ncbi:rcorf72 [Rhizobium grahamii CCGE 502]|uniref:Rcorf72 n=1 Tax=Rhizobium grahamii CCGE 502 TaxID=990285 RepID=S3HF71_9HYPH|nr:rcorf72 [Rhizobium grahamii CCGE 502]
MLDRHLSPRDCEAAFAAAVNQMDHDTQQNAAMAEESNAASAALAGEAARLRDLLSAFRLEADDAVYAPEIRVIAGGRG